MITHFTWAFVDVYTVGIISALTSTNILTTAGLA